MIIIIKNDYQWTGMKHETMCVLYTRKKNTLKMSIAIGSKEPWRIETSAWHEMEKNMFPIEFVSNQSGTTTTTTTTRKAINDLHWDVFER